MLIAGVVGLLVVIMVARLSRRGQLSFRYTIGWIGVASFGILAGLFVPLVEPIANALGLSAAALIGLGALVFITAIAIQLSISISGLQRQMRTLTETIAYPSSETDNGTDAESHLNHVSRIERSQAVSSRYMGRLLDYPWNVEKIAVFFIAVVSILTLWPILTSPLTADDILNAPLRPYLINQSGNLISNLISHIEFYTRQWMNAEGRFFPGAVTYGSTVHLIFQGNGLYKTFLLLLGFANSLLLFRIVQRISDTHAATISSLVFLGSYSLRYRYFHDGVSSFAGLVPFALLLLLLCLNLIVSDSQYRKTNLALLLTCWLLASLTYEHVATFVLGVLFFCWSFAPRNNRGAILIGISLISFFQFAFTMYLRGGINPGYAYQLNFGDVAFVNTFWRQLMSALPSSQLLFSDPSFIGEALLSSVADHALTQLLLALLVLGVLLGLQTRFKSSASNFELRKLFGLMLIGLNMWICPALITGATPRWQAELPQGQGYLAVTLQGAGIAIVGSALFARHSRRSWYWQTPLAFLISLGLISNIFWNWHFN